MAKEKTKTKKRSKVHRVHRAYRTSRIVTKSDVVAAYFGRVGFSNCFNTRGELIHYPPLLQHILEGLEFDPRFERV